jgi:hypothetical protein
VKFFRYIKEIWLSWLIALFLILPLKYNEEISTFSENSFIYYLSLSIPFVILILFIAYYSIFFGIEENLWDDFKKGRDYHIDRMIKSIKVIFILIIISNIIWVFLILFNLFYTNKINYINSILLILTPVIFTIFTLKDYYNLQKEYNS